MGRATVLFDVFVPTILIRETPEEGFAGQAARNVANTVFAFFGPVCQKRSKRKEKKKKNGTSIRIRIGLIFEREIERECVCVIS